MTDSAQPEKSVEQQRFEALAKKVFTPKPKPKPTQERSDA